MYSNGQRYIPDRKPPLGALLNPYLLINRGLVGLWLFNEGSGNRVYDLSGNENDGTLAGTAHFTSGGKLGPCIILDGDSDYVDCGDPTTFDFGAGNWALSIWAKRESSGSRHVLFGKDDAGNERQFVFLYQADDTLRIQYFRNDGTAVLLDTTATFTDTLWHHLVAQRVGDSFEIYVDAVLSESGTDSGDTHGTMDSEAVDLWIGARDAGGVTDYFDGQLNMPIIYNRALSASEGTKLYQEPFCGFRWMSIEQLASYYEEEPPPEIQALFMDLSTQIWTIKHSTGLFTKL